MLLSFPELASVSTVRRPVSKLRTLAGWYQDMEGAEQREGWLAWCRERHLFVACSEELVNALAAELRNASGPVLEIGAGNGELAEHLQEAGVEIIPTDWSPGSREVVSLEARDALNRYRPETVLTSFLPVDAGIELDILKHPNVRRYVYVGPPVVGRPGPHCAWNVPGWRAEPLHNIEDVLLSRLDYLSDFTRQTHCRRATAVRLWRAD
ncbi:MAG: hypothetical protein JOY54_04085 [Acidobacteriaceae bacterium]|nr:hypothetical protein [Acidobacteriaceae bacterium]